MMQEQLSLPKESEVLAHISGKCFDIVDFSDLMSKQRPVEDTVLERWIMLSESTKRNDTAVWSAGIFQILALFSVSRRICPADRKPY